MKRILLLTLIVLLFLLLLLLPLSGITADKPAGKDKSVGDDIGRYQLVKRDGENIFMIDTKEGRVWELTEISWFQNGVKVGPAPIFDEIMRQDIGKPLSYRKPILK